MGEPMIDLRSLFGKPSGACAGLALMACAAGAGTFSDWKKPVTGTFLPTGGVKGDEAIELVVYQEMMHRACG